MVWCHKQSWHNRRVWPAYQAIGETCCQAWNALMAMPDRIASMVRRKWAKPEIPL